MQPMIFILSLLAGCGGTDPDGSEVEPTAVTAAVSPDPVKRMNVLFILWDTVRADRMSLYGHTRETTPALDAFAKDAVVYEAAWSPGMWTLPSHASMFTGLPPASHGANASHRWLDHHHTTVAELLSADGYDTFAFSSNLIASPMANLMQGFETIHTTFPRQGAKKGRYTQAARASTRSKLIAEDASTEVSPAFGGSNADKWEKAAFKDAGPVIVGGFGDWLDERESDAPFFAYLNMMEAHTPRIPTAASRNALLDDETRELGLRTDVSLFKENTFIVGKHDYSTEELAAIRGVYDATLLDLDKATATLLDDLKKRDLLDNTLVILVSDHGESLGEHRMMEHRWAIHEPLLNVPLVVRWPGVLEPSRIEAPVSTIDLYATVLDAAGITPPVNDGTRSRSLRGGVETGPIYAQMVDPFASQLKSIRSAYPEMDLSSWTRTYSAVRQSELKYVRVSDGEQRLFDLVADPGEDASLTQARASDVEQLHALLEAWESGLVPYDPGKRRPREGAAQQNDEERAMLQALGYAEPDEEDGN